RAGGGGEGGGELRPADHADRRRPRQARRHERPAVGSWRMKQKQLAPAMGGPVTQFAVLTASARRAREALERGEGVMSCSDNMHGSPTLTCPCCGYQVVSDSFEICKICGWEYDPYGQNINPDEGGGPNPMTLREAQRNYASFGAKGERYLDMVRAPTAGDRRHPQWKPL